MPSDVMELDPSYRFIFDNPRNGSPEDISSEGCIALALMGADLWNAWRRDFPCAGGETHHGFFVSSEYGNFANFRNYVFEDFADFSHFEFGANAIFENVEFRKFVGFEHATFGENANFELTRFLEGAVFQNAKFEGKVSFRRAKFPHLAFFSHSQFRGIIDCTGTIFSGQTNFDNVIFSSDLVFNQTEFNSPLGVSFKGGTWESFCATYQPDEIEKIKLWGVSQGASPGRIKNVSFAGSRFKGTVDFSGNDFGGTTKFSKSFTKGTLSWIAMDANGRTKSAGNGRAQVLERFEQKVDVPLVFESPPLFHNCKFNQNISFDGAIFPEASGFEGSVRAYRTLKLAFAQQQAVREEQRFFRLEMAEEARGESWRKRYLYRTYQVLSDFGFSLWRPLLLLVAAWLIFASAYGVLANLSLCLPFQDGCKVNDEWLEFSLLQVLPLAGFGKIEEGLRSQLFANSATSVGVTIAVLLHKSITLLALFLSGLALRNLFKMK